MAKEVAITKRAKISEAQQYVLLAVLGASLFLGAAVAIVIHLVKQISFNAQVIAAEEQAIVAYSDAIKNIGVCTSPKGSVYTTQELESCHPDDIEISSISGTLRANVLGNMAANAALNSVPKETIAECTNPATGKNYTYEEMTSEGLANATTLIQKCSALRIIPDALPAFKNEAALLSSLNKIFYISGIEPNSLSPTGDSSASSFGANLGTISVRLSVESDTEATIETAVKFLNNIERSIREFNIERATIEWGENDTLMLNAQATAYYMTTSTLTETNQTITAGEKNEN